MYSQHAKHGGTRGVWGHAPPRKILKIDTKYCNLGAFPHITLLKYSSSACVNGKVLSRLRQSHA